MYTHPATAEQCLHNALKIVNAMRFAGIDYDIQVSSDNILLKHIYTGGDVYPLSAQQLDPAKTHINIWTIA